MPSGISLFRNKPLVIDPAEVPAVPNYAVLLWHSFDGQWDDTTTENGSFDGRYAPQYYRRLSTVSQFPVYPDINQVTYPIIKCVADNASWKSTTGELHSAFVSFANTVGTLFEAAGAHSPTVMLRSNIYNTSGFRAGDTVSSDATKIYTERTGSASGHTHFVDNVRDLILKVNYGDYKVPAGTVNPYSSKGLQSLQIDLLIRDPLLSGGDKELKWLPKGVVVFGANLPEPDYSRDDVVSGSMKSADGKKYLPLLAKHSNVGLQGSDDNINNLTVFGQTNVAGNHNHQKIPIINKTLSNRTNQTGYNWQDSGDHAHIVRYDIEVYLKAKFLKAWVTTLDKTPIADGTILLYAIGPGTGYNGPLDDDSGLPPHWHFCDGTNGTPDLRDYYIYANFADDDHDVEDYSANEAIVIRCETTANGNHSHYSSSTTNSLLGSMIDVGGHGNEVNLDHTHTVSPQISFKKRNTDAQQVINFKTFYEFEYTPPTVTMAFIMYNATIA